MGKNTNENENENEKKKKIIIIILLYKNEILKNYKFTRKNF